MDFAYFTPTQTQSYPFANTVPHPQSHGELDGIATNDALDASYLASNYDAFRYPHISISASPPAAHNNIPTISSTDSGLDIMDDAPPSNHTRASSEEKEGFLTPAQSRRKAQNRAAQRAFRERKERHVRDLEAKLTALETHSQSLTYDNERLKRALRRAVSENEMLRGGASSRPSTLTVATAALDEEGGTNTQGTERLLSASAAWDLIQSHPLVKQGLVDIADVCERMRREAKCDGQGPVYEEGVVWRAVEESTRGGGDELI